MASSILIPLKTVLDDKGIKQAQESFGKLGSSLKGVLAAAGVGIGIGAIASALKDSTKAAGEDIKSQALLANQLRNTIGASNEQIDAVEASIKAMQTQAAVADDVIRPAFASLVRSTGNVGEATRLTSLALDVAAGTGKDLGAVATALGKSVNGSDTALLKLIPSLKNAVDPMAELQKQFNGAAEAAADNDPYAQLQTIFGEMQEQIGTYLLPYLQQFAEYVSSPEGQAALSEFADGVGTIAENIVILGKNLNSGEFLNGLASFSTFLAQLSGGKIGDAFATLDARQKALQKDLVSPDTRMMGLEVQAKSRNKTIADAAKAEIAALKKAEADTRAAYNRYASLSDAGKALGLNVYSTGEKLKGSKFVDEAALKKAAAAAKAAAAEAKAIAKNIAEVNDLLFQAAQDAAKKAAEVTKAAAEDALQAAKDIVDQLQTVADDAQAEADKYTAILSPLPPTVIEVYQTALDNLAKIKEESQRTLEDMSKSMANLRAEAYSAATAFKDLAKTAEPIGSWEQKLNDSFSNLTASADSAFNNKLITADAYKNLKAYAGREKALLTEIAKKRDALAEKISLAKTLYSSTKAAVLGFGNITGLLKQQSETITETSTKIIDGISVTFSKTFEKITSTNLVDEYKKIIDKTKTFAANLKALKDQGLNKDLFAQIVGAGVDVGGETAAALAAGGPDIIAELNGLYDQLQTVSSQVAETTAVVMYNNGQDVTGGFIEGLIAEDNNLADTATAIATLFADTFETSLTSAMDSVLSAMKAQLEAAIATAQAAADQARANVQSAANAATAAAKAASDALNLAKLDVTQKQAALDALGRPGIDATDFIQGYGRVTSTGTNPLGQAVTINVNAGVIANKQELPGIIVDALGTYTKQSGAGGLTRVLGL
jgi:hypothetical protein